MYAVFVFLFLCNIISTQTILVVEFMQRFAIVFKQNFIIIVFVFLENIVIPCINYMLYLYYSQRNDGSCFMFEHGAF